MKDPPESILTHIRQHALAFRKVYSQTAECEYYANVCPRCDAFAGDHFLHAPSSVFFPTDERDVEQLRIVDVPIAEPMTIVADAGFNTWVSRVFD
ncbi:MAG: hypothetical protein R3B46_02115 [Phycisphaerales bacterium]|nr:hypothetical protein [Phycisphaerales bacterium]